MSYHPRVQSAPRSKSEKNQSQDGSRKNSLEAKPKETQKQKIKSLASVKVRISLIYLLKYLTAKSRIVSV